MAWAIAGRFNDSRKYKGVITQSFKISSPLAHDANSQAWMERIQLGLMQFNQRAHNLDFAQLLVFAHKDTELLGGLIASTGWSWLHIDTLFVEPSARRQGVASALLKQAEHKARGLGCIGAYVDTFDFQAPAFYLRQGYTQFGLLADMPPGSRRFYLQKRLDGGDIN